VVNRCLVAAGDSYPELFWKAFAEIFGQTIMEISRSGHGRIFDDERRGSDESYDEPDESRNCKATESTKLKPHRMRWAEVVDYGKGKHKDNCRKRRHGNESDVDGAMKLLPRATVNALGKMGFVIMTHLWREASDVIAPSREDVTNEWIDALTHINL